MSMLDTIGANSQPSSSVHLSASESSYLAALIQRFCYADDLSTYDPYDLWKTPLGFHVKNFYNCWPRFGLLPAGVLTIFDNMLNNDFRWFYRRMEYPVVRAFAALCLVNLYGKTESEELLEYAKHHLQWLLANACRGYNGLGWGLGYRNAISKGLIYDSNTPLATMTPYALEAFVAFNKATNSDAFIDVIDRIFRFFDQDIQAMEEDEEVLATSYAPFRDRTVINASSYAMYSYALCLPHVRTSQDRVLAKVHKLYEYIRRQQRADGSWFYAPQSGSFIDCFHSCIVLKNVAKTSAIVELRDSDSLIDAGYGYIRRAFLDQKQFLFRRFSLKNKPGLIKFDLYDNAEVLNLALLLGDSEVSRQLLPSIIKHFCRGLDVYSQIDVIGALRNKNTLRWAVMPFLYAASQVL